MCLLPFYLLFSGYFCSSYLFISSSFTFSLCGLMTFFSGMLILLSRSLLCIYYKFLLCGYLEAYINTWGLHNTQLILKVHLPQEVMNHKNIGTIDKYILLYHLNILYLARNTSLAILTGMVHGHTFHKYLGSQSQSVYVRRAEPSLDDEFWPQIN